MIFCFALVMLHHQIESLSNEPTVNEFSINTQFSSALLVNKSDKKKFNDLVLLLKCGS